MANPRSRTAVAIWSFVAILALLVVAWLLWSPPAPLPQETLGDGIETTE